MLAHTFLKNLGVLAFTITCSCISNVASAQDGALDSSFGKNGKVITDAGGADVGSAIAIQSSGKIILAGVTSFTATDHFVLVRYLNNGKIDSSFGVNGKSINTFKGSLGGQLNLAAIKVQQDDKIVVTGFGSGTGGSNYFALMRFNANGIVDSTFGIKGRVTTDIDGTTAVGNALAIQTDGKIVLAGTASCDLAVCRYKTNGQLDSSFGLNGIKIIDAGGCDVANTLAVQPDKKIIVAGYTQTGPLGHFLLVRIDASGEVDPTFGTNGQTTTDIRQTFNVIVSCALQPDGKIVAVGWAKYFAQAFGVARYNSNGIIDSSFGTNGKTELQFPGDDYPKAAAMQADGKIVIAGWINDAGALEIAVARYKTNGELDSTFGYDGQVTTNNADGIFGYGLAIQADAKILVGGYTYSATKGNDLAVVRYKATASVLPIKLSSFTGAVIKSEVGLNWATSSEINSSYFGVERSATTVNFSTIGKVNAEGISNQLRQYSFLDMQPLKGDNFYRLKQVDKDGKLSYSKTVHIVFNTLPYLSLYPNPTRNTAQIGGLNAGASLVVFDASGKAIRKYTANTDSYAINIQGFAAGVYIIQVEQDGKTTILKLVKE